MAYREQIRSHHPDRAGAASSSRAARIIEAYRVLDGQRSQGDDAGEPSRTSQGPPRADRDDRPGPTSPPPTVERPEPTAFAPPMARVDADTLMVAAPAEETFRWLIEAAGDMGEITYLDRSGPILEVLCRFEEEPATSLMFTIQGRAAGTDVFCTVESIEARPSPPTAAVVDVFELAFRRRQGP